LTGVIGTLQAAEALKLLIGIDHGLSGKLLTFNALNTTITRSILTPDPACPVCSGF
jgi:molybdopterin/thiamine biosynthesis adenylyltransferase